MSMDDKELFTGVFNDDPGPYIGRCGNLESVAIASIDREKFVGFAVGNLGIGKPMNGHIECFFILKEFACSGRLYIPEKGNYRTVYDLESILRPLSSIPVPTGELERCVLYLSLLKEYLSTKGMYYKVFNGKKEVFVPVAGLSELLEVAGEYSAQRAIKQG